MAFATLIGCGSPQTPVYPTDTLTARDGTPFSITFFKHASLSLRVGDNHIYVDPVSANANYASLPKADLILITHSHFDHLDPSTIDSLSTPATRILCDSTSAITLGADCHILRPGDVVSPRDYVSIRAIPAYNTSEGHLQFHPQQRKDCGYVLTIGGSQIYIAGDSEPTPEMLALRDIDIAFLPVNQPYTMTVDQAVEAIKAIRPAIFYPYHYGEVDEKTDTTRLVKELTTITDIRMRPME